MYTKQAEELAALLGADPSDSHTIDLVAKALRGIAMDANRSACQWCAGMTRTLASFKQFDQSHRELIEELAGVMTQGGR